MRTSTSKFPSFGRNATAAAFLLTALFCSTHASLAQERMFILGEGPISHLAVAPSSDVIAVDTSDSKIIGRLIVLFDIKQGKKVGTIQYNPGGVGFLAIVFSRDGKSLVASGGMRSRTPGKTLLNYWHVPSAGHIKTLEADGQVFAMTDRFFVTRELPEKKLVKVFDLESGEKIAELKPLSPIEYATVSPDGKHLAVAEYDGPLHVFELPSAKLSSTIRFPKYHFRSMKFSEHEPTLAVSGFGVVIYDMKTGKKTGGFDSFPAKAISSDGKMMACKSEGYLLGVRDKRSPDALHILSSEKKKIITSFIVEPKWTPRQMQFTPDNRSLIAAGTRGIVRVWDVSKLEP